MRAWCRSSTSRRRARARSAATATRSSRGWAPQDLVKFVICGRADYEWSRAQAARAGAAGRLHGAVLAQPRAAAGARARRLDPRGPPAGALPDPAPQVSVGQRAGEVGSACPQRLPSCCCPGGLDSATALAIAARAGLRVLCAVGRLRPAARRGARRGAARRARAAARASTASCASISPASAARR